MKKFHVKTNIDIEIKSPALKSALLAIVFIIVLFIIIYPMFVFRGTTSDVKTQTVVQRTVYETIDTEALAVRLEEPVINSAPGTVVPAVINGSKVAIGDSVVDIYSSESAAENAARLKELEHETGYYKSVVGAVKSTMQTDIEFYKTSVNDSLFALEASIDSNELSDVYELSRNLREVITKKQIATGAEVDVSAKLAELENEYNSLKSNAVPTSTVYAEKSGYYVNTCDGYENFFDYKEIKNVTFDEVEQALLKEPDAVSSQNVGKIITDFNWYLVCNTTVEQLGGIVSGDTVTVMFANSSVDELKMQVAAVNQNESGESVTLILKSNVMNEDIAALRVASIKIKIEAYNGLVVDRQALRTVDGVKGVYIKVGNVAEFRAVNIVYSDESLILADNSDGEISNHLELYDEIILEGTDLYDSKLLR